MSELGLYFSKYFNMPAHRRGFPTDESMLIHVGMMLWWSREVVLLHR